MTELALITIAIITLAAFYYGARTYFKAKRLEHGECDDVEFCGPNCVGHHICPDCRRDKRCCLC